MRLLHAITYDDEPHLLYSTDPDRKLPMTSETWRYTAFTTDPAGGNPAGVVVGDTLDDDATMQRVAAEIGFSETAFLAWQPGAPRADIRYFSPEREVTFCGHATIAAAVVLAERAPQLEQVVLTTRQATVPVDVERRDGHVVATLTSPPATSRPVPEDVLAAALGCFGWSSAVLDPDLPPAVADAGAAHLVLPVADEATLATMAYDFDGLRTLMLEQGWTTVDVVWRRDARTFEARNPFPVGGVVEDPATGAAAAAFGAHLRDRGAVTPPATVTILQGHHMGRPSRLEVEIPAGDDRIRVRGAAVPMLR